MPFVEMSQANKKWEWFHSCLRRRCNWRTTISMSEYSCFVSSFKWVPKYWTVALRFSPASCRFIPSQQINVPLGKLEHVVSCEIFMVLDTHDENDTMSFLLRLSLESFFNLSLHKLILSIIFNLLLLSNRICALDHMFLSNLILTTLIMLHFRFWMTFRRDMGRILFFG